MTPPTPSMRNPLLTYLRHLAKSSDSALGDIIDEIKQSDDKVFVLRLLGEQVGSLVEQGKTDLATFKTRLERRHTLNHPPTFQEARQSTKLIAPNPHPSSKKRASVNNSGAPKRRKTK